MKQLSTKGKALKSILLLILTPLLISCSQEIVIEKRGDIYTKKFSFFQTISSKVEILSEEKINEQREESRSCSYSGLCVGCDFEMNCMPKFRLNCPGSRQILTQAYRQEYKIVYWAEDQEYKSPKKVAKVYKEISELSPCQ